MVTEDVTPLMPPTLAHKQEIFSNVKTYNNVEEGEILHPPHKHFTPSVVIKLMKGKTLRKYSLHGKIAASVLIEAVHQW